MALGHLPMVSHRLPHDCKGGLEGLKGPFAAVGLPQRFLHLLLSARSRDVSCCFMRAGKKRLFLRLGSSRLGQEGENLPSYMALSVLGAVVGAQHPHRLG